MSEKAVQGSAGGAEFRGAAGKPVIETIGLTKRYGKARGIERVDLAVFGGDIFGFIGPNGAGKSTLIRTLLGLIKKTSGEARVLGRECGPSRKDILSRVGYMPSEAQFYHGMKVADVIAYSARLRRKDCTAEAARLCERLGLDPKRKVEDLSLGNRKKVSIVCALQHAPELYVLDEPTSGLDPLVQKEFFALLLERHAAGATIMLSSHVLSEVQRYCEHAAIIREGRIIASGSVEALSASTARRVRIRGFSGGQPSLIGVRNIDQQDGDLGFLYQGDVHELVTWLAGAHFDDVMIEEPDIEEVFMHYYEDDAAARVLSGNVADADGFGRGDIGTETAVHSSGASIGGDRR
ncbi:ABC transporter ATP-binding protein [Raoultibacter phocaeensis]|uniref:ABC transporter ATP-binding protein n=1 Tax=Raoultibacter phocaeensis TaxID=2479841 RepID=UPI00111A750D|nr:ABC transporter ATP-binding protein [Raoultibacter phocaeensis]